MNSIKKLKSHKYHRKKILKVKKSPHFSRMYGLKVKERIIALVHH